jgi:hypothetical protein
MWSNTHGFAIVAAGWPGNVRIVDSWSSTQTDHLFGGQSDGVRDQFPRPDKGHPQ